MSAMVVEKECFERVGKFMKAWKNESDTRIIERLERWQKLNRDNLSARYTVPFDEPHATFTEAYERQPLIGPEQMLESLRFIQYQCVDYAEEIDSETLLEIEEMAVRVQAEFQLNSQFRENAIWG